MGYVILKVVGGVEVGRNVGGNSNEEDEGGGDPEGSVDVGGLVLEDFFVEGT